METRLNKVLIIIILLTSSIILKAQFFITIEPFFLRPGILYNYSLKKAIYPLKKPILDIYGHTWYGDIKAVSPIDGNRFYTQNIKIGFGLSYKTEKLKPYLGINYNYFFDTHGNKDVINLDRIKKVSFEIGVSYKTDRLTMLMVSDLLNFESMVGFSYKLKVPACKAYHKRHRP